jgi:hypothetical protein
MWHAHLGGMLTLAACSDADAYLSINPQGRIIAWTRPFHGSESYNNTVLVRTCTVFHVVYVRPVTPFCAYHAKTRSGTVMAKAGVHLATPAMPSPSVRPSSRLPNITGRVYHFKQIYSSLPCCLYLCFRCRSLSLSGLAAICAAILLAAYLAMCSAACLSYIARGFPTNFHSSLAYAKIFLYISSFSGMTVRIPPLKCLVYLKRK